MRLVDKIKKLLVMIVAIVTGSIAFGLGMIKHPEAMAFFQDDSPGHDLLPGCVFVEVLAFTVFVACACASFAAGRLRVPGFHPDEARGWAVVSSLPLVFIGPVVVVWLLSRRAYLDGVLHGVIVLAVAWNLVALNARMRKALDGNGQNPDPRGSDIDALQ